MFFNKFIKNCCKNTTANLQVISRLFNIFVFSILLTSCSAWGGKEKSTNSNDENISVKKKDWEPNVFKRVDQEKGEGITIFGSKKTTATQGDNVIWQASLEVLADIPLAQANYTGGVIITDWYNSSNSNESIKISIFINSARLEVNSFDVKSFKKTCSAANNCQTVNLTPDFNQKIKDRVLEKARIISVKKETSKK
jgi:hypothetical protein